jgi:hypothetical protein
MFLLTLYGKSQTYTTKARAEQEASRYLKKNITNSLCVDAHKAMFEKFNLAFQQENYGECIKVWNDHVQNTMYNTVYRANIVATEVDKSFT